MSLETIALSGLRIGANGRKNSWLYRPRQEDEIKNYRTKDGRESFSVQTIKTMFSKGYFKSRYRWTVEELLHYSLKNSITKQKINFVEAVKIRHPGSKTYIRQLEEHYAALRQKNNNIHIKYNIEMPDEIRPEALKEDLYLNPEIIAEITGLSPLEIESLANVLGMKTIHCGPGNRYALNQVTLIPHLNGIHDKREAAVKLYNEYFAILRHTTQPLEDKD